MRLFKCIVYEGIGIGVICATISAYITLGLPQPLPGVVWVSLLATGLYFIALGIYLGGWPPQSLYPDADEIPPSAQVKFIKKGGGV